MTTERGNGVVNPDLRIQGVLSRIEGGTLIHNLLELAAVGGEQLEATKEHPLHIATNRLALSEADMKARYEVIEPAMVDAGLEVTEHPMALIGTMPGKDPDLAPVVIMSHTDTVPRGDIYDGTLGVIGGIEIAKAMKNEGFTPQRSLIVVSLTGEESAAFGNALVGSKALFQGLDEKDLASRRTGGPTLAEALGADKAELVTRPYFGPRGQHLPKPHAVIELHVEQGSELEKSGHDIGIVNAIASPVRYRASVGDTALQPEVSDAPFQKYYELEVQGIADHSGTTPMGPANRADGLVITADILTELLDNEYLQKDFSIGETVVENGAMNKVPGVTKTWLRIVAEDEVAFHKKIKKLQSRIAQKNVLLSKVASTENKFKPNPLILKEVSRDEAGVFFDSEEIEARQRTAFELIEAVNRSAEELADEHVVGTVGTYKMSEDGKITLEIDMRGINQDSRDQAVKDMRRQSFDFSTASLVIGEPLAGSSSPVMLDPELVAKSEAWVSAYNLGKVAVVFSKAGHDAQNAARAGNSTLMIFTPSNNEGMAHHPDAYTEPKYLQSGVRALAVVVLHLCQEDADTDSQMTLSPEPVIT